MGTLIKKDMVLLLKPKNIIIILFYALIFGILFQTPIVSTILIAFFLISDLINREEKNNSLKYFVCLPVKKESVVASKYIDNIIFIFAGFLLSLFVGILNNSIVGENNISLSWQSFIVSFVLLLVFSSFYLPLYFKYGKIALNYMLVFLFLLLGVVYYAIEKGGGQVTLDFLSVITNNINLVYGIVVIASLLLLYVSFNISKKIFNHGEL